MTSGFEDVTVFHAIYLLLVLAFGAGGTYFLIKQSRKDVNGVGRKVDREISKSAARHQNVTVALMLLAPEQHRDKIADLLKEIREDHDP